MALPPQMVDMAMGAGGPATEMPEELMVELPEENMLPDGIELAGMEEMVEVQAEMYDHNANPVQSPAMAPVRVAPGQ